MIATRNCCAKCPPRPAGQQLSISEILKEPKPSERANLPIARRDTSKIRPHRTRVRKPGVAFTPPQTRGLASARLPCRSCITAGARLYDAVVGNGPGFGKSGICSANKRGAMSGAATERTYRGKLAVSLGGAKRIGLSDARRPAYGPKTDMCPIRLAYVLGARGAGPAATVCIPIIAAQRPIPVHSSGEPCSISGRSSHQFWRGMSSGSGTCSPYDIR